MIFGKVSAIRTVSFDRYQHYIDKVEINGSPIQVIWRYHPGVAGGYMTPAEPPEIEILRAIDLQSCLPVTVLEESDEIRDALRVSRGNQQLQ